MTSRRAMNARFLVRGSLALVASAPLVLLRCAPHAETRALHAEAVGAPGVVDAAGASAPDANRDAEQGAAPALASAPLPVLPSASATPRARWEPPPPAPFRGALPSTCAGIESALRRAFTETACASDDDCTTAAPNCACHAPVNHRGASKVDALNGAFEAQKCAMKGPPRPCATCPAPSRPQCTGGACARM